MSIATMIPTPLAFDEVAQEVSFVQATHLGHMHFGKALERFNAVHVVFPASERIFIMMNLMMAVTIVNVAVKRPPTVRAGRAISHDLSFNDGAQRVARAVIDNIDVRTTPHFSIPATGFMPLAPHPRLPRTCLAPK